MLNILKKLWLIFLGYLDSVVISIPCDKILATYIFCLLILQVVVFLVVIYWLFCKILSLVILFVKGPSVFSGISDKLKYIVGLIILLSILGYSWKIITRYPDQINDFLVVFIYVVGHIVFMVYPRRAQMTKARVMASYGIASALTAPIQGPQDNHFGPIFLFVWLLTGLALIFLEFKDELLQVWKSAK